METGGARSAYGASLAGGNFDFVAFLKQPQTIARLLSWLFAIVVFGCITGEGFVNQLHASEPVCVFNRNNDACHYAVGVGMLAFLVCVAFLVLDAYFPHISNAKERRHIVIADLVLSGVWAGLWFVCFCFLANQWARTIKPDIVPQDSARATIAFSFFSILTWGFQALSALRRFHKGLGDAESVPGQTPPLPSAYPTARPESFQPAPFTSDHERQTETEYSTPVF
ncbi:hypothetical protein AGOR_G00196000 [Albula goreensis]|uniref:Synaptogyrin n=1 Tax=Albula goreensis TaxID=1534307 RepID=A0A8T3CSB5_9TELE|nr:hypothetical protein AGOR_G00196000 [Albula goreensis]